MYEMYLLNPLFAFLLQCYKDVKFDLANLVLLPNDVHQGLGKPLAQLLTEWFKLK